MTCSLERIARERALEALNNLSTEQVTSEYVSHVSVITHSALSIPETHPPAHRRLAGWMAQMLF
jgi:hypothetical protein